MVWESLTPWQKIIAYGFIVIALFLYAVLSRIRINGRSLIPTAYRLFLAVLFPFAFVLLFVFGTILLGLTAMIIVIFLLFTLLGRKRIKIKRIRL